MQGKIVLAVQDSYIQSLPARAPPTREQGDVEQPYFNSGVMVIDLEAWRAAGIEQCCLDAASRLQHRTKWLDQHLLNRLPRWSLGSVAAGLEQAIFAATCSRTGAAVLTMSKSSRRRATNRQSFTSARKRSHGILSAIIRAQEVLAYRAALRATALGGRFGAKPSCLQNRRRVLRRAPSTSARYNRGRCPGPETQACVSGDAAEYVETGDSAPLDARDRAALGCSRASRDAAVRTTVP